MAGSVTAYTEEKGAAVIAALRSGRRPGSPAHLVGVCRDTLYNWRVENADFAAQWDEAVAYATDLVEEVVYGLARSGDLQAAAYWLKAHRPHPYDRGTMLRFGVLQASLAAAQANGGGRVVIDIGPGGLPILPPPEAGDPLRNGGPLEPIFVLSIPDNHRDEVLTPPVDDGSGRTYPLPQGV